MKLVQVSNTGFTAETSASECWSNSAHRPFTAGSNMSLRTVPVRCSQGALCARLHGLDDAREQDVVGQMLWSQQMRATEYFSRWIALKESI